MPRQTRAARKVVAHQFSDVDECEIVESDGKSGDEVKEEVRKVRDDVLGDNVLSLIDELPLSKPMRLIHEKVSQYPIHNSLFYPKSWYMSNTKLDFFVKMLEEQSWEFIMGFTSSVLPVELIQFYSTVQPDGEVLTANVNGKEVSFSIDDFGIALGVPSEGEVIGYGDKWCGLSKEAYLEYKQFLDGAQSSGIEVLPGSLSVEHRFIFLWIYSTLVPRITGRHKLHSHEVVLIKKLSEGVKINLPMLVFKKIAHVAQTLKGGKGEKGVVLPYGMWISRLLELKQVVVHHKVAMDPSGEAKSDILISLGLAADPCEAADDEEMVVGETMSRVSEQMGEWMKSVDQRLGENRENMIRLTTQVNTLIGMMSMVRRDLNNGVAKMQDHVLSLTRALVAATGEPQPTQPTTSASQPCPSTSRPVPSVPPQDATASQSENNADFSVNIGNRTYQFWQLPVPKTIAVAKLSDKKRVTLENAIGDHWPVTVSHSKDGRVAITSGWKIFLRDNQVAAGDSLSFTFISDDVIKVLVSKSSNGAMIAPQNMDCEFDELSARTAHVNLAEASVTAKRSRKQCSPEGTSDEKSA